MFLFLSFSSQVTTNDAESFGHHIGGDVGIGYVGFGGSGDSSKYSSQSEYSSQVILFTKGRIQSYGTKCIFGIG